MNAVYDFFINEWYFSIPLVVMSLIAAALVIWRLLLNTSANTDMDDFLPVFQQTLRKNGIKGAVTLCKEEKGLIPNRLFVAGLEAVRPGGRGDAAEHGQRDRTGGRRRGCTSCSRRSSPSPRSPRWSGCSSPSSR